MVKCPFCDDELYSTHLKEHGFKFPYTLHAAENLLSVSIVELYQGGMSAKQIADKIRAETVFKPIKNQVLKFLSLKGVERRQTADAMVVYYQTTPVWNKGLTKDDHPAIKQYADSRFGENNPIHKLTHEERCEKHVANRLKREGRWEEYEELCQIYSAATTRWFEVPENRAKYDAAYDAARPRQRQAVIDGIHAYYERHMLAGTIPPTRAMQTSKPEQMVKDALEQLGLNFRHQWYYAAKSYDFYLFDYRTFIEVNGLYWHAHPSLFPDENARHPDKKKSIKEIREYDAAKNQRVIDDGYDMIILWEKEFNTVEEAVSLVLERLKISV